MCVCVCVCLSVSVPVFVCETLNPAAVTRAEDEERETMEMWEAALERSHGKTSLGVAGLASHALSLQLFANSASKVTTAAVQTRPERPRTYFTRLHVTVFNSTVYVTATLR